MLEVSILAARGPGSMLTWALYPKNAKSLSLSKTKAPHPWSTVGEGRPQSLLIPFLLKTIEVVVEGRERQGNTRERLTLQQISKAQLFYV